MADACHLCHKQQYRSGCNAPSMRGCISNRRRGKSAIGRDQGEMRSSDCRISVHPHHHMLQCEASKPDLKQGLGHLPAQAGQRSGHLGQALLSHTSPRKQKNSWHNCWATPRQPGLCYQQTDLLVPHGYAWHLMMLTMRCHLTHAWLLHNCWLW